MRALRELAPLVCIIDAVLSSLPGLRVTVERQWLALSQHYVPPLRDMSTCDVQKKRESVGRWLDNRTDSW